MIPHRSGSRLAGALSAAALGWAVILPLAPLLHARGLSATAEPAGVLAAPSVAGALVCHRRADRSFHTGGVQWPVCARCSGLYLSGAAGIAAVLLLPRRACRALGAWSRWRPALMAAALPTAVSWAFERTGWWLPGGHERAWLAAPLGLVVGALLALVARDALRDGRKT